MIEKKAIIDWIPYEEGGRWKPPTGEEPPAYWTVVKFVDDAVDAGPPTNGWTLVVRLAELRDGPFHWLANVHFRFEDAPQHFLTEGTQFELYEGKKRVATGRIISPGQ